MSTVTLYIPCYIDQFFPQIGRAAVQILEYCGCTVHYPAGQTCCGQPLFNSGHWQDTLPLAENCLDLFASAEVVVCPSGSCVSMVKKMYGMLPLGERQRKAWMALGSRIFELSEFLYDQQAIRSWPGVFQAKVAFLDACHGLRELGLSRQPRALLSAVRGLEIIEMREAEQCCGFGGVFSAKFPQLSQEIAAEKIAAITDSGAEILAACDASCLMHLAGHIKRTGSPLRCLHIAEILAAALASQDTGK